MHLSIVTLLKNIFGLVFIISLFKCVPVTQSGSDSSYSNSENIAYEDKIYKSNIKSVRFYVNRGYKGAVNEPAVNDIRQILQFVLEFDELAMDAQYFQAKIIHCDRNWVKSILQPIEYINSYNEYDITDYEFSVNARIPYTHYTFLVPKVSLPGNYLLVIYKRDNPTDVFLTRRFMIFDNQIQILPSFKQSSGVHERRTHQQADFKLHYQGLEILNPLEEISVIIRQNQRWDNALIHLKPIFIREIQKELDYTFFNLENNFHGGNEFRFFDLRSTFSPGQNVRRIIVGNDRIDAFLNIDKDRGHQFYGHHIDLNGGYYIENFDSGDDRVESQYVHVHFFLESEQEINSDVYIFGGLTNWKIQSENKMIFDSELKGYRGNLLLKQGWYDYTYFTPQIPFLVEGSHFQTENSYEIFVYYRPIGGKADLLAGYKIVNFSGI